MEKIVPPDYEVMFSVEVTTYNQEKTIAKVLDSILSQVHNYSYEIIIADDCSTDKTREIIKLYHVQYPEIINPIYNETNLGAMNNYYNNLSRARGKYIMGAGGDDFWLPGKVTTQIEFMERNLDFGVCYGRAQTCDEFGNNLNNVIGAGYDDYRRLLEIGNNIPSLTACFRHSIFKDYLANVAPQTRDWLMEDYPFWIYCAYNTNFHFFDKKFGTYTVCLESVSHSQNKMKQLKYEQSISDIVCFFSTKYNACFVKDSSKSPMILRLFSLILPYGVLVLSRKLKNKIWIGEKKQS